MKSSNEDRLQRTATLISDHCWRKKVYLAVPYTTNDDLIKADRVSKVDKVAARLILDGVSVYSPISSSHPLSLRMVGDERSKTWDLWQQVDVPFLLACDKLMVLKLKGWEMSVGVTDEIAIAEMMGIEIEYVTYNGIMNDEV